MSINRNILDIIPENWGDYVEPSDGETARTKYQFNKGKRNLALYGKTGKPNSEGSILDILQEDIRSEKIRNVSFLPLGEKVGEVSKIVSAEVFGVVDTLNALSMTRRFERSDISKKRDVNAREAEVGLVYPHYQCNILDLIRIIKNLGYELTDISHLLTIARFPQVKDAIEKRFRLMGVSQVNIGCSSGDGTFHDTEKERDMPITQLLYGRGVVQLDVTYPKPRGEGYQAGHALWAVEKI